MLEQLKQQVCEATQKLVAGLALPSWGTVSGIDRASRQVVIRPAGDLGDRLNPEDLVVVGLEDGAVIEGRSQPSVETLTHLVLYRAFVGIGGVVRSPSLYATAWAQAGRELPALGTSHADYFRGAVPCTRLQTPHEIRADYEGSTGQVIVERFRRLEPLHFPGVLVACHGPYSWGASVAQALEHALVLEHLARLGSETLRLNSGAGPLPRELLEKQFQRKQARRPLSGPN
jgi:L-ribulose-5-phosphate 4-epimerase